MTRQNTAMPQPGRSPDGDSAASPAGRAVRAVRAVRAGIPLRRSALVTLLPWAGLGVSLALWGYSLAAVQADRVAYAGLGLVAVLGASFWAALGLLLVSLCFAIAQRARWPVAGAHL